MTEPKCNFFVIPGQFVLVMMCMASMSLALTVTVIFIHNHGGNTPIPQIIKRIFFQYLARMLCMKSTLSNTIAGHVPLGQKINGTVKPALQHSWRSLADSKDSLNGVEVPAWAEEIIFKIDMLTQKEEEKDRNVLVAEEWKALARVLDRVFFWVTLLGFLLGSGAIFLQLRNSV